MVYSFLRSLFAIAVRIFFRKIEIRNRQRIPKQGPLLIIANHPSTFMDPIVIAVMLRRKVYFLAKGEVFRSAFAKWLLPKFNMIPVYRKQDDPSLMHKNDETFQKCFEHLSRGHAILIFPEGISLTERKLREIKTGAARIILGAEKENNYSLGVRIMNVGINYSDPHKFRHDLFLNVDEPFNASEYFDLHKSNPHEAVTQLTERMRERMESHIILTDDEETDKLLSDIEVIYKFKLAKEFNVDVNDKESEFLLTRNMSEVLHRLREQDHALYSTLKEKTHSYLSLLLRTGIKDEAIGKAIYKRSFFRDQLLSGIYLILGFPLFIYGLLNNYIPYKIPGLLAGVISKREEYRGALMLSCGVIIFAVFWPVQTWLVYKFSGSFVISMLYLASLPLTGIFAYRYHIDFLTIRNNWKLISLFSRRGSLVAGLIERRQELLKLYDIVKNKFFTKDSV